jgi:DNA-binding MarR family transcriptional regulator
MSASLPLFETLSRRDDPPASKVAARRMVETGAVASHEAIILNLLRQYPGRTSKQLSTLGPLDRVAIARRLKKMEEKKLIRRTQQGREECCWWVL